MKSTRNIIRNIINIDENLCNGCGNCVIACAEGAIEIINGKAKVIGDKYCDGLGACIGDCPENALSIIKRESEEFDEVAVEELVKNREAGQKEVFKSNSMCPSPEFPVFINQGDKSALGQWPVKIRLVPVGAPFLQNADLLIAADCVAVACKDFHDKYLKGKAVLTGCPKFGDKEEYIEKFLQIFKNSEIKSISNVIMDVPCCSALPVIIKKALDKAGKNIPIRESIIRNEN